MRARHAFSCCDGEVLLVDDSRNMRDVGLAKVSVEIQGSTRPLD